MKSDHKKNTVKEKPGVDGGSSKKSRAKSAAPPPGPVTSQQYAAAEVKKSYTLIRDQLLERKYSIAFWLALGVGYFMLPSQSTSALSEAEKAACASSLSCLGEQGGDVIRSACRFAVGNMAKRSVEWESSGREGWVLDWLDSPGGQLILSGNQVSFENDDGGLTRMAFTCQYDQQKKTAKIVRLAQAH